MNNKKWEVSSHAVDRFRQRLVGLTAEDAEARLLEAMSEAEPLKERTRRGDEYWAVRHLDLLCVVKDGNVVVTVLPMSMAEEQQDRRYYELQLRALQELNAVRSSPPKENKQSWHTRVNMLQLELEVLKDIRNYATREEAQLRAALQAAIAVGGQPVIDAVREVNPTFVSPPFLRQKDNTERRFIHLVDKKVLIVSGNQVNIGDGISVKSIASAIAKAIGFQFYEYKSK
jgi:hypothetical protein